MVVAAVLLSTATCLPAITGSAGLADAKPCCSSPSWGLGPVSHLSRLERCARSFKLRCKAHGASGNSLRWKRRSGSPQISGNLVDSLRERLLAKDEGGASRRSRGSPLPAEASGSKAAMSNKIELWPSGRESEERDTLAVTQTMPADELQARYGGEGVSFGAGGGLRVATLRLANGSVTRVVLEGGRVTSWQMMMWHGAPEEMLRAGVASASRALEGGISARIAHPPGVQNAELAAVNTELAAGNAELAAITDAPWGLLEAAWDKERTWARVVLGLEVAAAEGPGSDGSGHLISARMVVHLSASALNCVLAFCNLDDKPLTLAPSIAARLAISRAKGIHVSGLQGSLRRRLPPGGAGLAEEDDNDDAGGPEGGVPAEDMWPQALTKLFGQRAPTVTNPRAVGGEASAEWAREERDEVQGPLHRVHRELARSWQVLLIDRGKRRSLSVEGLGLDALSLVTSQAVLGGLGDTDYLDVTFQNIPAGVVLEPKEEWVGTVVLGNRNI